MSTFFEVLLSALFVVAFGVALGWGMIGAVHVLDWLFGDRVEHADVKD